MPDPRIGFSSPPTPRWAFLIYLCDTPRQEWTVLTLTEDCIPAAQSRGWVLLASETDILSERI